MKKYIPLTLLLVLQVLRSFGQVPVDLPLSSYGGQPEIRALKSITLKNGFHIPLGSTVRIYVGGTPQVNGQPSTDQNYILTRTFRKPVQVSELNQVRNIDEENQTVQYFDGLGRPSQVVQLMASPTYKDIVQYIAYDGFGRESRKYLPYAERTSESNGSFKTQAEANQIAFYNPSGGWDAAVVKTPYPYAETVFENSPLNRVLEQGAPGQAWQPVSVRNNVQTSSTSGHTVVTAYGTNAANDVRLWTIDGTGANGSGYYLAGRLYKTVIKDENWVTANGKGGTIEEYKDFEGRVVLKRVWESDSKALHTYYVYDDFGDLRYVIPPGYTASSIVDHDLSAGSSLVYAYRYDGRRRLIEKKLPGKGWEYFVYNRNDQVILTQDANQRERNEWLFTKYDAFGRVIITGTYINAGSQSVVQAAAIDLNSSINKDWETAIVTGDGYSNTVFPTGYASCHSINYYDDYTFPGNIFGNPVAGQAQGIQTKGLLTASKVATLGTGNMLLTVNYYDVRARLVGVKQQNHLGGTDIITNEYSFVGELTSSKREHKAGVGGTTTMLTKNTYDHVGRLLSTNHKLDSQAEVMLAQHVYNEVGQLKEKQIGLDAAGTNPITTISYTYNPRGWLESASSPIFSQQLFYHTSTGGVAPQYNGNIASQQWTHRDETTKQFTYTYDKLNRLKDGYSSDAGMREVLDYDDMGNITNLKRDGHATGIQYQYGGNQLLSVSNQVQGSYEYDANGNAKRDRMGFKLTYNHLNLPSNVVTSADAPVVSYTYDALGNKLQKISTHATNNRNYVSGIEYKSDNSIDLIHTSEGTAFKTGNAYVYHYNLQDHLGNVRATIRKVSSQAEVLQKDDYYPFGKQRSLLVGSIENKYLYNGKEKQAELGGQYDYGARFYDAEIGRWNVVDPLQEDEYWSEFRNAYSSDVMAEGFDFDSHAEQQARGEYNHMFGFISPQNKITAENSAVHYSVSPYAYVLNNPIIYNDPLGLDTNKTNTIQEVNVYGYSTSGLPHWLGPSMIAAGQPMVFLKPVGALGSQSGSSIASWTLSKVFPQNIPALKKTERKVIAMVSKKAAKKAGTAVLGRFLGRLVPGIGWGLTTYDVIDNKEVIGAGMKAFSAGAGDYYKLRSDPKTFYMYAK